MSEVEGRVSGATALPVTALLYALRGEGFLVGVDDHLRIARLLASRDRWPTPELRWAIRALLAKSREESELFDRVFERVWADEVPVKVAPLPVASVTLSPVVSVAPAVKSPKSATRVRWWAVAIACAAITLTSLVAYQTAWRAREDRPPRPVAVRVRSPAREARTTPTTPIVPPGSPTGTTLLPAVRPDSPLPGRAAPTPSPVARTALPSLPLAAPASPSSPLAPPVPPPSPVVSPAPSVTRAPDHAPVPATSEPTDILQDAYGLRLMPPRLPRWIWPVAVLLGVTATALAALVVVGRRRRRWVPTGPWNLTLVLPEAWKVPAFDRGEVMRLAEALSDLGVGTGQEVIDVPGTIEATIHAGGLTDLRWRRERADPEVALTISDDARSRSWAGIYDELALSLRLAGIPVSRWRLRVGTALFDSAEHRGRGFSLARVLNDTEMAIVLGPVPTKDPAWARSERVRWLDPGTGNAGIEDLLGAVKRQPRRAPEAGPPDWSFTDDPTSDDALVALRSRLGDAGLQLLLLAALPPVPDAALAVWLARSAGLRFTISDELRLRALPWFADRRWPKGWRRVALASLKREDRELFERGHASYAQLLEHVGGGLPAESAAAQQWWAELAMRGKLLRPDRARGGWHVGWGDAAAHQVESQMERAGFGRPRSLTKLAVTGCTVLALLVSATIGATVTRHWARWSHWKYERAGQEHGRRVDPRTLASACEADDANACLSLGVRHWRGLGVLRSDARAAELLERSCAFGSTRACWRVGTFFEEGDGTPRNEVRALEGYRRSCVAGG